MENLIAFFNMFFSYLLLFGLIVVLAVIACLIGIRLRKRKDRKEAELTKTERERDVRGKRQKVE